MLSKINNKIQSQNNKIKIPVKTTKSLQKESSKDKKKTLKKEDNKIYQ